MAKSSFYQHIQLQPFVFTRHNRPLHTLWLESQVWFSARDLGRLMGRHLDSHALRRLDPDQSRTLTFPYNGTCEPTLMINESAVYMILVHYFNPENRTLRRWLTNDVISVVRDEHAPTVTHTPTLSLLRWAKVSLSMLQWQNEPWIRLRDVPEIMAHPDMGRPVPVPRQGKGWRFILGMRKPK